MPIIKECVVCGFRLPCVKRRDTRYCTPSCRARAGRARRLHRHLDALRVHHTALRWRLLAYWFVGLRARRGMRPLETKEMAERLAQTVKQLADAKHRAATLKAQLARLKSGLLTANDAHHAEREALQAHLSAAEDEVERLQQELEAAAGVDEEKQETLEEIGMRGNIAAPLESLEFRVMDLMAENERLKESATAHRSFRDAELYDALERVATIEKEKANWDAAMLSPQGALSQQTDAAVAAKEELSTRETLIVAATKKIQRLQQDKALSLNLADDEDDSASALRAELKRLKHQLHQTKQERDEAREQVDKLSAQSHRPEKQRRDPEQRDDRAELKKAVVEQLEHRRSLQNTMTVSAHRYEGPYHPSRDRLLLSMLDELMANVDLARQQYIHSKQQTARSLNPHLTPAQQAYALTMAARWWLVASPPSSYTKKVSWAQDGYTLDADAELYLYAHSRDRSAEATWQAFWLEPVQPRRRRKRR